MTTLYLTLLSGALGLYTLSMVTGFFHLFQPRPQKTLWCKRFILAGSSLHLLAFFERCFQAQTLAVTNLHESLSFFALLLGLAFLLIGRKIPLPTLGTFISPLLVVFTYGL